MRLLTQNVCHPDQNHNLHELVVILGPLIGVSLDREAVIRFDFHGRNPIFADPFRIPRARACELPRSVL